MFKNLPYFAPEVAKAPVLKGKPLERQESTKQARPAQTAGGRKTRSAPASEAYLERAAVHYLARFASSTENFKAVLRRKVQRRGLPEDVDIAVAEAWIEALVEKFTALGHLDDEAFARARAGSLLRRGKPRRVIRMALADKGVDAGAADAALQALDAESDDPDLDAARAFARRKRLGPWGPPGADDARRRRDLAAFARAGFTYQLARRVLDEHGETSR